MSESQRSSWGAHLKGLLKLVPSGSQVVLSMIFVAGVVMALCATFGEPTIGAKNADRLWYLAVACCVFGGLGWLLSRRDQDMAGAHPTTTSIDERGNTRVSADPRVFGVAELSAFLATRASGAIFARPVAPAGMLDDKDQPSADNQWSDQAKAQFHAAQQRAEEQRDHLRNSEEPDMDEYDPDSFEWQAVTLEDGAFAELLSTAPVVSVDANEIYGDQRASTPAV